MHSNNKGMVARLIHALKRIETAIIGFVRRRAAERRRRIELEEKFYRELKKHYAANNMPIMWEDDWGMQR
jgi:hypothetical protein